MLSLSYTPTFLGNIYRAKTSFRTLAAAHLSKLNAKEVSKMRNPWSSPNALAQLPPASTRFLLAMLLSMVMLVLCCKKVSSFAREMQSQRYSSFRRRTRRAPTRRTLTRSPATRRPLRRSPATTRRLATTRRSPTTTRRSRRTSRRRTSSSRLHRRCSNRHSSLPRRLLPTSTIRWLQRTKTKSVSHKFR